MYQDLFVLLNSMNLVIIDNNSREIESYSEFLDALDLDQLQKKF